MCAPEGSLRLPGRRCFVYLEAPVPKGGLKGGPPASVVFLIDPPGGGHKKLLAEKRLLGWS